MKPYLDADLDIHRLSVFHGGLKPPLLHSFDRLGIQSVPQATNHAYITGLSCFIDDEPENALSLRFSEPRLFRVLRVGRRNSLWSRDAATDFEDASANTATASSTHSGSVAYANAAA